MADPFLYWNFVPKYGSGSDPTAYNPCNVIKRVPIPTGSSQAWWRVDWKRTYMALDAYTIRIDE